MNGYYASIQDLGGCHHGILAGPFRTHEMALAMVDPAQRAAEKANPAEAAFSAFGTLSLTRDSASMMPPGVLNERLGVMRDEQGWAQVPAAYREAYRLLLNARITGPQAGKKWTRDYQRALASDVQKIGDYLARRIRHTGCSGFLSTLDMQRRYPHINRQREG